MWQLYGKKARIVKVGRFLWYFLHKR